MKKFSEYVSLGDEGEGRTGKKVLEENLFFLEEIDKIDDVHAFSNMNVHLAILKNYNL